jgi:hypothetical protein
MKKGLFLRQTDGYRRFGNLKCAGDGGYDDYFGDCPKFSEKKAKKQGVGTGIPLTSVNSSVS